MTDTGAPLVDAPDPPGSAGPPAAAPLGSGTVVAMAGIAVLAVFNSFWRLGTADWKIDESLDGAYAWEAVRHGTWGLEDGHPVAIRWFMGLGQLAFGQGRWGIRVSGALASVAAVWLLYLVGKRLHSRTAGLAAAAMWAALPRALVLGHETVGPLRADRFGYLEPFMVVALLGATLTGWNWIQHTRMRDAVATGLLIGTATAFKPTAIVVVVPVVAMAIWRRRSVGPVLGGAAVIAALAVVVLPLTYLPLGTTGPGHLRTLIDYQLDHARTGHFLVVDGKLIDHEARYSHLLYQWRGMGWAACTGLLIGIVGAWVGRRRRSIDYVTAILVSLLGFHLLSTVALPHYYILWAPFSVLLASMGLVELARRGAPSRPPGDAAAAPSPVGADLVGRGRRAPGATTAVVIATVLLAGSGLAATVATANLQPGDYARLTDDLDAAGVHPAAVRYQGEAVDRYFPHAVSGQIGFTDASAPFDLLVLDARDVPLLPAGTADEVRAMARSEGLVVHHVGRLEVWYADPGGGT